jgi:hypothetical protein
VALSAAALAEDTADDKGNILASFLEKAKGDAEWGGALKQSLGVFDGVFDLWGTALLFYNQGVDSLIGGVGGFLRSVPLVNQTPLASWAEDALREAIGAVGLEGADLDVPKPVLVNSTHVLRNSDSTAASGLASAKEAYSSLPGSGSGTLETYVFNGLLMEAQERTAQHLEQEITIFTLSFGDLPGLPQIPIKIALPPTVVEKGRGLLDDAFASISSSVGGADGDDVWE